MQAIPCGTKYNGKKYYRFTVTVTQSALYWKIDEKHVVIARTPEEAIELIRSTVPLTVEMHPAEWVTYGPKGGRVYRSAGWETLIGEAMFASRRATSEQLAFTL